MSKRRTPPIRKYMSRTPCTIAHDRRLTSFALRPAHALLAWLAACTNGGELQSADPVAPAPAPAPVPVPAPLAPAVPLAPVPASPPAVPRLHPATTTATLHGLTGDDAGLIVAVGAAGTILRSEDHGQSWRELTGATTHNLAAAWRGPAGTLFAVGDGGTILRSRDRGLSWELRSGGTDLALGHLAGNTSEVVVAGAGGTILRSRDDGDSWITVAMPTIAEPERRPPSRLLRDRDVPRPPPGDDEVLRGMFRPDEPILGLGAPRPGELWIALRKLVWRRPDARSDWRVLARATDTRDSFAALWVGDGHWAVTGRNTSREGPDYFVGVGETSHVSRWREIDSRLISAPRVVGAPQPGGAPPLLYLAGDGYAVHWSEDGGERWDGSEQSAVMQSPYPLSKRALWVAADGTLLAAGTAGAVMRSIDRARTWTAINGASREPLFGGALGRDGSIFTAVAQAVLRGRGDQWGLLSPGSKLPIGAGEQADGSRGLVRCCTDVWVAPDGSILAAGNGLIWRSRDDGRTWSRVHNDEPRWDCCWSLWGDERGVFGVDRDFVLSSVDHGKSWKRSSIARHLERNDSNRFDISGAGDHLLIVGDPGLILHSSDRGRRWARRVPPTREPLHAGLVADTPTGLLALAAGEKGTLLRSTDAVEWRSIALPTKMRLLGVHRDASRGELYVVGESGLLRSRDEGLTWTLDPAVRHSLRSVFGDGRGQVIATGDSGLVLRLP